MKDTTGVHLWLVLWKAYAAVRAHADRSIHELGLGLSDFGVLDVLLHKGALPVNTIGAKIGLTSGSISTAVDRLAGKGLVERKDTSEDRRARVVHLTAPGRKLAECAFGEHAGVMERACSALSARERALLIALLKKLGKSADAAGLTPQP